MKKLFKILIIILAGLQISAQDIENSAWFDAMVYADNKSEKIEWYADELPGPLYMWYDSEDSTIRQEFPGEIFEIKIKDIKITKSCVTYVVNTNDSSAEAFVYYYPELNTFSITKIKGGYEYYIKFERYLDIYTKTGFDTRSDN